MRSHSLGHSWKELIFITFNLKYKNLIIYMCGTQWRSCLRHYATSRKVAGSIPHEVIGFFFNILIFYVFRHQTRRQKVLD
jgi:hypothetical protein